MEMSKICLNDKFFTSELHNGSAETLHNSAVSKMKTYSVFSPLTLIYIYIWIHSNKETDKHIDIDNKLATKRKYISRERD